MSLILRVFSASHVLGSGDTAVSRPRRGPQPQVGGPQFLVGEHLVIKGSPNYKIRLEPSGKSPGTHAVQT